MKLRRSVRALIIDPHDSVLLVRFHWEGLESPDGFWANPGGEIEAGETRLDAIQRELREEIGMNVDHLGPEVWTKTALFPMSHWDGQVDHIHMYRTERFEPSPELAPAQLEAEGLHEIRWWSLADLTAGEATFAPRALPDLMSRLRLEGVPSAPIELRGF